MRTQVRTTAWKRLSKLRRQRRVQNIATLGLVILGPILAVVTYLVLGPLDRSGSSPDLRLILLTDLVYVLVVATLVLQRIAKMIAARRAKSAGSRLHLRLTGVFALVALIPTVLVAVFAALTVNVGLEGWFSDRVRQVVGNSLAAAEAYQEEHRRDLIADSDALADFLNASRRATFFVSDGDLRQLLTQGQSGIQRGLREAYVINGSGEIRARGERSYLFDYEKPSATLLAQAETGKPVIVQDWDVNEFRALLRLEAYVDRYLYVSRDVDGEILSLLDETKETVNLYNQLESERGRLVFEFGLLYLGFAVILILAAIWLGLWFAERLSRPVGRLTGAAQRIGAGDLDVRVIEEDGDDEIAMLGRIFNQMTRQLKRQRDSMMETNREIDERRRQFDSVLSSITAGVIGLDENGNVDFLNRAAMGLLDVQATGDDLGNISVLVPEFATLFKNIRKRGTEAAQAEVNLLRNGKQEDLLVRMAKRTNSDGDLEGYVVAFDDVTDLVSAQRMAAWGDVARRIAHEIKNPLTPIQLSADRLRRKFVPLVGDQGAELEQYTNVIVRQTEDLRRIVDEFSKFARMPEPDRRSHDLVALLKDAVILQQNGQPDVKISTTFEQENVIGNVDATMIGQAFTNLIKNAGEATETYREKHDGKAYNPQVRVGFKLQGDQAIVTIADNGIGLPENRARLFEPYVTTRDKGTGLGLSIVKKIIEEHGGTLELVDAKPFKKSSKHFGAMAVIRLPFMADGQAEKNRNIKSS